MQRPLMKLIKLVILPLAVSRCASIERPETDLCVVNAPAMNKKCFSMKEPKRVAKYIPLKGLEDLNKNTCIEPEGFGNLKAYLLQLRAQ